MVGNAFTGKAAELDGKKERVNRDVAKSAVTHSIWICAGLVPATPATVQHPRLLLHPLPTSGHLRCIVDASHKSSQSCPLLPARPLAFCSASFERRQCNRGEFCHHYPRISIGGCLG